MVDAAKRLASASWWRWVPGMRWLWDDGTGDRITVGGAASGSHPDLSDPATMGCLLAMLWEVDPRAGVSRKPEGEFTVVFHGSRTWLVVDAPTPGEAIARALLEARAAHPEAT